LEFFNSAFFNFDFPEFVARLALGNVLERAEFLALHEWTATFSFTEFRLLAIWVAFHFLEVRTLIALANLLLQTALLWSSWNSDAFLARIAASALGRRILQWNALLLGTTTFVLCLLQFLARFAFDGLEFAVIWLDILTFKGFAATILHLNQFLAGLAFWLDDFGTDSPNASVMGTFAFVVCVEFVLLLVLLTFQLGVQFWASAAFGPTGFQLHLLLIII